VFGPPRADAWRGCRHATGLTLADPELRRAFVQHARFIALNYRPAYLILGVEVNAAFEANPDGYAAFLEAYVESYAEVKAASPRTLVFPSFQYEQLLGQIPWEHPHARAAAPR
jgi:hypothetical protein